MSEIREFTTSGQLRDHIHAIHDFIRNNGGGYGAEALKIFNLFYTLKLVEDKKEKLELDDTMLWSNIKKQINEYKNNNGDNEKTTMYFDNIITSLSKSECELSNYIAMHQYLNVNARFYVDMVNMVDQIPINTSKKKYNVDLAGKVYEYFIGRDSTAISELGAYFTNRQITTHIIDKIKPIVENNKIKTMIDPFAGSGGMTLTYTKYLVDNYKNINWDKEYKKIYHYDMASHVVKSAAIEFLALTGNIPKLKNSFAVQNSFKYEFDNEKFDYVISNPPYGGDKTVKSVEHLKNDKIINYNKKIINDIVEKYKGKYKKLLELRNILTPDDKKMYDLLNTQNTKLSEQNKKECNDIAERQVNFDTCFQRIQEFAKNHKLAIKKKKYDRSSKEYKKYYEHCLNDKESCSLILLADLTAKNGTCVGVLKEGLFFDNKYSDLRKIIIENYDVTNVISIDQNQFENTSTKTSIIIFKNTEKKTTKVQFSELKIEYEPEDVYVTDLEIGTYLKLCKGDVKLYSEDIYDDDKLIHKKGSEMVYEQNICVATYKQIAEPTIVKSRGKENLRYDYSLNYKNYKDIKVVCPDGYELKKLGDILQFKPKSKRNASFASDDGKYKFYTSSDKIKKCNECDFKDDELKLIFGTGGDGSLFLDNKFSCSTDNFVCFTENINITKYLYHYIKYNWVKFVSSLYSGSTIKHITKDKMMNYQIPIPTDIKTIEKDLKKLQKLHDQITHDTKDIPAKEKTICDLIKKLTDDGKNGVDYEEYKLGDICDILPGTKHKTKEGMDEGKYRFYNSSQTKKLYLNNYEVEKLSLIIGNGGNANIHIDKCFTASKHVSVLQNNKKYLENYLWYIYYYLLNNMSIFANASNGSTMGWINKENIKNIQIPIPTDIKTIMKKHKLEELFDEVDKLKDTLETNKKEYKIQLDNLFNDFKEDQSDTKIDNKSDTKSVASENSEQETDSEEYEIIEHNNRKYYLDGKKVYRINKDNSLGEYYGRYKNGEVIKSLDFSNKEEKKVIVKTKK